MKLTFATAIIILLYDLQTRQLNLPQPETHQSLDVFVPLSKTIGQDPKYEHLRHLPNIHH